MTSKLATAVIAAALSATVMCAPNDAAPGDTAREEAAAGDTAAADEGPGGLPTDLPLETIEMPAGFEIAVFADGLTDARSLARSPSGVVYVGTRREGSVYAVVDEDGDHAADRTHVIASGLTMPNGVAWRDGALYVAEVNRVLRYDGIDDRLDDPPEPVVIRDDYPTDEHHGWKYIAFGPDGWLYLQVGAPCNICLSEDPIYASITRITPDGGEREIYAHGVRNTVGFDWHPETGVLWFTDNGRDRLGDNRPPDELNRAPEPGLHFGYPFCHGGDLPDPEFGDRRPCDEFVAPARNLGPHVAALGMIFYTGEQFPAEYRGQIFIPEHGSWNRSEKIGYRVTLVRLDGDGNAVSYEPFAEGWLQDGEEWGRPVDLLQLPDGSLLLSDDDNGVIYRISHPG